MTVTLDLKVTKNRDYISSDNRQVLALIGLETRGFIDKQRQGRPPGFEIALVIDCSGSMNSRDQAGREKLGEAIKGLWAIVDKLQPNDVFSVIGFDGRTEVILNCLQGSQKFQLDRSQFEAKLRRFGGMTNIHAALDLGRKTLANSSNTFVRRIILLSDGDITEGPGEMDCYKLTEKLSEEGVVLDVLGYGYSDLRWDFLSNLAGPTGGERLHVTEAPDAILEGIFSGAKNAVAANVRLSLEFAPNVLVGEYYRCEPSIMYMGKPPISATKRMVQFQAGQVEMGKDYVWLFELEAPANITTGSIPLATVNLQYRLPDGSIQNAGERLEIMITDNPEFSSRVNLRYKKLHEEAKLNKFEVALGQAQKSGNRQQIEHILQQMIKFCESIGLVGKAALYRQQLVHAQGGGDINELAIEISKSTTQSSTSAAMLQGERERRLAPPRRHVPPNRPSRPPRR